MFPITQQGKIAVNTEVKHFILEVFLRYLWKWAVCPGQNDRKRSLVNSYGNGALQRHHMFNVLRPMVKQFK